MLPAFIMKKSPPADSPPNSVDHPYPWAYRQRERTPKGNAVSNLIATTQPSVLRGDDARPGFPRCRKPGGG